MILSIVALEAAVAAAGDPAPPAAIGTPERDTARVLVLSRSESANDTGDEMFKRIVRAELGLPEARFYPGVDLFQTGRLEPDPPPSLLELRASVPPEAVERVVEGTRAAEATPWNGLDDDGWSARARELLALEDELWFLDREELREPLFRLYVQIGRAAEGSRETVSPLYTELGGRTVNLYATLAGGMVAEQPDLLATVADPATSRAVAYAVDLVTKGTLPPVTLSFADASGTFDPVAFGSEYRLSINGLERALTDPEGVLIVPPGRIDVELERADGHGLSARSPVAKPGVWTIVEEARQRIDGDLRDVLAADTEATVPRVDEEVLAWLAIYAELHPSSEIFVAVPDAPAGAARRAAVWRWDRTHGLLSRLRREPAGFAVRFAAVATIGAAASSVRFRPASEPEVVGWFGGKDGAVSPEEGFTVDGVPMTVELRGHYRHFYAGAGLSYTFGWTGDDPWADAYPVEGNVVVRPGAIATVGTAPTAEAFALRERSVRRLFYGLTGAVFGPGAARGFGPRVAVRGGWTNVPHAAELTAHAGMTHRLRAGDRSAESEDERVQIVIDAGLWGGALLPVHDSLYVDPGTRGEPLAAGGPFPTFGLAVGTGLTF